MPVDEVVGVLLGLVDELVVLEDDVDGVVDGLVCELLVSGSARIRVIVRLVDRPAAFCTVRVKVCLAAEQANGRYSVEDDVGTPAPS